MRTYWLWRYSSTILDASRTGRFIPWERAPFIHWIGGWVSLRAAVEERKFPSPHRESNPRTPIAQPVTGHCID
jgi:hypothetical protein